MNTVMKTAVLGLAAAGMILMGGCGGSGNQKAASSGSGSSSQSALMQKIKKDGKLVVGTASGFPPYEFLDTSVKDRKKIDGIDMKIAEAVAQKLGVKLEVQDMTFQSLLSSITTGKVDIAISAINPTEERKKTVDFSNNYLEGKQTLLVRKEDAGKYKSLADFEGKKIAVQKSTIQEKLATSQIPNAQIVALTKVPDALLELKQGKVDAVPVQNIVGGQYLVTNDDLAATNIYFDKYSGGSAVAVPKGSDDVIAVINEVIKENQENGNIDKWVDEMTKKAVENAQSK
ncbi:transporter substrate-binding domain-containing protein [uncultured Dialister sp.]|uniref:transporter substrate-binding domain-containing protein n=1 Tax=uncultured Dialister sp. TaxID=278064 RepID=UPI0026DDB0BD|nr:transporter substrate-binding domain-containing protein [uncultured Dialister sp.]